MLKPGGLLIMETPNPENIVVATRSFYLIRLIKGQSRRSCWPSLQNMRALLDKSRRFGFKNPKTWYDGDDLSLQDVFAGASPDYAVVAQKHADDDVLALTNEAFNLEYGLSLENLLGRWHGAWSPGDQSPASRGQSPAKPRPKPSKPRPKPSKPRPKPSKPRPKPSKPRRQLAIGKFRPMIGMNDFLRCTPALHGE